MTFILVQLNCLKMAISDEWRMSTEGYILRTFGKIWRLDNTSEVGVYDIYKYKSFQNTNTVHERKLGDRKH